MKFYTGWQYLLIDVANHMGLDKQSFEDRILWATSNLDNLENLTSFVKPKKLPLYLKACMAIRDAQAGKVTGHMVHMDATCSGIQIMSALSGCKSGAMATGMIDPSKPHDAYTEVTTAMNDHLTNHVTIDREDAKRSVMTTCYGSKKVPKELFGEDTPELAAFYKGLIEVAPGTWEVLQDLLNSWQPYALSHDIKLPDGFDAHIKVMEKQEVRIEVDELDHASFTYVYYDNIGTKKGISLPANVVHSVDGFIVREMHRRCNYDVKQVQNACAAIKKELAQRTIQQTSTTKGKGDINTYYYLINTVVAT